MLNRYLSTILLTLFFVAACSNIKIEYMGDSFKPIQKAEIYFNKKDVKVPFSIMGNVSIKAPTSYDPLLLQYKLRKFAESKGADAAIIQSFKTVAFMHKSINEYNGYLTGDPYYIEGPNNMGPTPGDMFSSMDKDPGSMYTYDRTFDFVIKAILIRYKNGTGK